MGRLLQVTVQGQIVDKWQNLKNQLVLAYWWSKGRVDCEKSAFAHCFLGNQ